MRVRVRLRERGVKELKERGLEKYAQLLAREIELKAEGYEEAPVPRVE